jgi:hypothetical protein
LLTALMFVLISATRVYVGGPDGLEFVWKGELSFNDTVVNLVDFQGMPPKDIALAHSPTLVSQMEDMGLIVSDTPPKKRRINKFSEIKPKQESDDSVQQSTSTEQKDKGENPAPTDSSK